jgi:hypothetical protein
MSKWNQRIESERERECFHNNNGQPEPLREKINYSTGLKQFTKINSKCVTNLNVKYIIIKFLEDNIVENLDYLGFKNDTLNVNKELHAQKNW